MKLKRSIGPLSLLFITLNVIIGTGIFFLPAVGAIYAGNASLVSWFLASIGAIMMAFYFGELVSMFPKAGGIYEYVKNAFGEFSGFLAGWMSWMVSNITIAMLIIGSLYFVLPGASFYLYIILSILIIMFFNFISYRGIRFSSFVLLFFGVVTISAITLIVVPGFFFVDLSNFSPFLTHPLSEVFIAIFFVSETFFGWESVAYLSEEVKNPRKNIPKLLVIATFIIAVISMSVAFVSIGVMNWKNVSNSQIPLTTLAQTIFGSQFGSLFAVLFFILLIGTAAGWIISSPRLLYAMSRNKSLPHWFSKLHKRFKTPHIAIAFQTIITIAITIIGFGSYTIILNLLLPLVTMSYLAVILAFIKFRTPHFRKKREFKAPFGEYGAILVLMFFVLLFFEWIILIEGAVYTLVIDLFLILLGIPLYFIIKMQTDSGVIEKFYDKISLFWDKIFPFWYGKKEIRAVIKNAGIKKKSKVLDFGCATGITTLELSKTVGEEGTVVAVDLSESQLERAMEKIEKAMQKTNVIFIKERELLPFEKNSFDAIVSVGAIDNFFYPPNRMKDIIKFLKPKGTFSFLVFGRSLGVPGTVVLTNEKSIKDAFRQAGLNVKVKREKKNLTEYWYIWGRKQNFK